jgi:hypothetical protein
MECAAGCGSRSETGTQDGNLSLIPPIGWVTIGIDQALPEPPYQQRTASYSAVCCSMDCVLTFLRRKKQSMDLALPLVLEKSWDWTEETRSDIAKRIGFLILEAVTEMSDDDRIVMLPLVEDRELLGRDVTVALLPGIPEVEIPTKTAD